MSGLDAIGAAADVVSAPVSRTPSEAVAALLAEHYGLHAAIRRLPSERDENFHLSADGGEYLLKISNAAELREVTDFQSGALLHLALADPTLPVPRLLAARDGGVSVEVRTADLAPRVMRLQTYLAGTPLHGAARSAAQCRNLGALLARLDLGLKDYRHPGASRPLRWDLQHASSLRPLLALIEPSDRRALVTRFLDRFEQRALPTLAGLRQQVIHNDFQPSNVLVDAHDPERITGIIDFGDIVEAPLVEDIAVAAAYHVSGAPAPLDFVAAMLASYHRVLPLDAGELAILFDLLATRLVLSAVIGNWRAQLQPGNRDYILRHAEVAWDGLRRLAALDAEDACRQLRRACPKE
jgi:Ser/Thr protein kinase RdoA (MazF antagonist)